jgi:hypothetical protein
MRRVTARVYDRCDTRVALSRRVFGALVEHTFLLLQYLHAIAVLWRGAGWAGAP